MDVKTGGFNVETLLAETATNEVLEATQKSKLELSKNINTIFDDNILDSDLNNEFEIVDFINGFGKEVDIFHLKNINKKYLPQIMPLIKLCNQYVKDLNKNTYTTFLNENIDELKELAEHIAFVGDSNVYHIFFRLKNCPVKNIFGMPGKNIFEQQTLLHNFMYDDIDTVVFWNGFNIKKVKDDEQFVNQYKTLFGEVKIENENIDTYVCSLLPATEQKLIEDVMAGSPHNIHMSNEFDNAIETNLTNEYIDIKFLLNEYSYTDDGFHFNKSYYSKMIPYVILYVNVMKYIE